MSDKAATPQLDTYLRRRIISERQHRAGRMFAADFAARYPTALRHRSMEPRVQHGSHGEPFSMGGIAAERAGRAARYLAHLRHVAIAVCCRDMEASDWAKEAGRKPEDGIVLLRFALDQLAVFYVVDESEPA